MGILNQNEQITRFADKISSQKIPEELYSEHTVFRGLRDLNGNGVVAGLTNISQVTAKKIVDGVEQSADGKLFYRGINVEDIVAGFIKEKRFGYEETAYLLLFGELPTATELEDFKALLASYRPLPPTFTRDSIINMPTSDMMNGLSRGVLTLYYFDDKADDTSVPNVLRQCLQLIAMFPTLAAYSYNAYRHDTHGDSLFIHAPEDKLSTAENLLHILRADSSFTELEARVLDLALVLHAEHGGGNNSAFAAHVVSSSGTDTYSTMAAALGSLKGPKHGGANNRVMAMMDEIKENVKNWHDEGEIADYLRKILHKEAFDRSGLIYGVGHAIYSLSDPRALLFEGFVKSCPPKKDLRTNTHFTRRLRTLRRSLLFRSGGCTRVFRRISTSIPVLFTRCSACRVSCLRLYLQFRVSRVGARICWRKLFPAGVLSAPHIRVLHPSRSIFRWISVDFCIVSDKNSASVFTMALFFYA